MACCANDGENDPRGVTRSGDCEAILREAGFEGCRVFPDGPAARIEVAPEQIARLSDPEIADAIHERFRRLGFLYVSIQLDGAGIGPPDERGLVAGLPPDEQAD